MTTKYEVGNARFGLEQPQKFGGVKPVDGIPFVPSGYLDLQRNVLINKR
jgi:hypothetical protein